ncbi:MAG: acyl carrier protein [Planctomycetia bacterium]|nr:acyl carrier protein [Planctomycetia bacterium]
MTADEIKKSIKEILVEIASEPADVDTMDDNASISEQLDLDSMDVLDVILALRKKYALPIPNEDVPKLATINSCVEYLAPLLTDR